MRTPPSDSLQQEVGHRDNVPSENSQAKAETPQNRIPGTRPKRARSTRRRIRPGAFSARRGGSRVSGQKRPKCLFLQCFAVGRAFLEPGRSVSRFSKPQSRGQCRFQTAKRGGSEGLNCPDDEWRISQGLSNGKREAGGSHHSLADSLETGSERPSQRPEKASLTP